MQETNLHLARWWHPGEQDKIICTLCPRYCKIGSGQSGFCFIRKNIDGQLYSTGYGHPTGFAVDPIEKKPLNHFFPGSEILSFGTAGCNLGCRFCQNWSMSKARLDEIQSLTVSPEQVIALARKQRTPAIAYTYNDPTIFGEYVIDISRIAREAGIRSVMVTSGYIDKEARKDVFRYIDAANVDLKSFSDRFYHKLTFSHLADVLDTLVWLKNETAVWLEITTLLIPGENDSADEIKTMCEWILENLGAETPLHFTAFHPAFKMTDRPRTPESTLKMAREIALQAGIKYCYLGNIYDPTGQTTYCPECGDSLIIRDWHTILRNRVKDGICPKCKTVIAGVFE
ncbi:MAG: AmmeMemoRadiSam system radical SAM enzyme [Calditrichales bacterium]|nr:MAG: AmmeMemoRadiSam system radical SAM enzyme [Calditrichales bacterium]